MSDRRTGSRKNCFDKSTWQQDGSFVAARTGMSRSNWDVSMQRCCYFVDTRSFFTEALIL